MKQLISIVRKAVLPVSVIAMVSVLFMSCLKDKHDNTPGTPVAGLMAFNLAAGTAVNFQLSGSSLNNNPLVYTTYTGGYLSVFPGQRTVDAFDSYSNYGSAIASVQGNFGADKYYSVFLVGTDSSYKNILVADNIDSLSASSGQAFVRYINAIPDSSSVPTVTVTANGNSVVNTPAAYSSVSQFTAVNPGEINIAVKNNAGIDANKTITVEQKKVYTILFTGVPASNSTPVEIKYITNGTLDDNAAAANTSGIHGSAAIN